DGIASEAAVQAMAQACRERAGADFGLAVGPFPHLDPAAAPERVHFALATSETVFARSAPFAGHPAILKPRAAKQALNFLRLHLFPPTGGR
ncbi:MAG TPA: CinA family protein, partial [Pirellulales bacterium]